MQIVTGNQMKKIDKGTIDYFGIPGLSLMEAAGQAVFEEALRELEGVLEPRAVVVCGGGNNGGDGYVAARLLHEAHVPVELYSIIDPDLLVDDAKTNYEAYISLRLPVKPLDHLNGEAAESLENYPQIGLSGFLEDIGKASLIVDAILGTGVNRDVAGVAYKVIDAINQAGRRVLSVDIPSGVGANDGKIYGIAVRASVTVTFQLPKIGSLLYPGADCGGSLVIRDIGIPTEIIEETAEAMFMIDQDYAAKYIQKRAFDSHKGHYGKVLIIAGSVGMAGSAALCAKSALRSGAGLVRIAATPEIRDILQILVPEATCIDRREALEAAAHYDAAVIGPGLGDSEETARLVRGILNIYGLTVIIDADGLNSIKEDPQVLFGAKARLILTPHPAEAGRLLGCTAAVINADRLDSAKKLVEATGAIVVLKGAATIVALPDNSLYINTTGNPGMATAGSGDVLSGAIASLAAQGIPWEHAAQTGVFLHGLAGDIMSEQVGEYGLIASDLNIGMALAIESIVKGI